jgi:hypothetical protein
MCCRRRNGTEVKRVKLLARLPQDTVDLTLKTAIRSETRDPPTQIQLGISGYPYLVAGRLANLFTAPNLKLRHGHP